MDIKTKKIVSISLVTLGGGLIGLGIGKIVNKKPFLFAIVGLVAGVGIGIGLFVNKELKGSGAVTPDAKKDRNITFNKI